MDAFSAQIVELVRKMPADAILALVRNQLGGIVTDVIAAPARAAAPRRRRGRGRGRPAAVAVAVAARPAKAGRPARKAGRKAGKTRGSADRSELLSGVEKVVKAASGLSSSEVARAVGIPQPRAASALKELKLAKRVFQGGDRRFARYAGDAKSAEAASMHARKTASGPVVKGKKKKK